MDLFILPWNTLDPTALEENVGRTTHSFVALTEMTNHHVKSPGEINLLHFSGLRYYYQKDYVNAEKLLMQTLSLQHQHFVPNNLLTAETLHLLAVVVYHQGRETDALDYLDKALMILKASKMMHPLLGKVAYMIGYIHFRQQKHSASFTFFQESLMVMKNFYNSPHPLMAKIHAHLATIEHAKYGRTETAKEHIRSASQLSPTQ